MSTPKRTDSQLREPRVDTDEFLDIEPWPPAELVGHLVANVALGRRGLMESDADADVFERETDRFELEAWARLELTAWLDAGESAILSASNGTLSEDQHQRCDEALIMASSIGWALYIVPRSSLPLITDGDPEQRALEWAPGPWTPVRNVVKGTRVRTDEALANERERWELVYWRCGLFEDDSIRTEDEQALRETVKELAETPLIKVDSLDFLLDDGRAFHQLQAEAMDELARQAEVRLRTLNWVCGYGQRPSSAPLYLEED